jgi:hypothetical protein
MNVVTHHAKHAQDQVDYNVQLALIILYCQKKMHVVIQHAYHVIFVI